MLVLSTLHNLLSQILSLPNLHTAVLLTPEGQLVSVASDPSRAKDDVRIVVGLSGEAWQEMHGQGFAMIDSEVGRIYVLGIEEMWDTALPLSQNHGPLMLLALNSTNAVEWKELESKGMVLARHLAKPLSRFREYLAPKPPLSPSSDRPVR